jgi:hypothetical protein
MIIIKNNIIRKAGIIFVTLLGLAGLTACNAKNPETVTQESEQIQEQEQNQNPIQEPTKTPPADNQTNDADQGTEDAGQSEENTDQGSENADQSAAEETADQYKSGKQLAGLLGLSKEELLTRINSDYNVIDEGGLEFTQPEIRIWFDVVGKVNQIFTVDAGIDFDGLKVGDEIKSFWEKLGDPTKDTNGEAHFQSGDIFMIVHYDTETGKSIDVYLLNKDF